MSNADEPKIPFPILQAMQDAVLLGGPGEIEGMLELVKDDEEFPRNLRYGLEAMIYFRRYYGKGGALEPVTDAEKKRAVELEAMWGRELIESLDRYSFQARKKYAQG